MTYAAPPSHLEYAQRRRTASCMDRIRNSRTRSNSGTLTSEIRCFNKNSSASTDVRNREAPSSDSVLSRMILVKAPDLFGCQHEFRVLMARRVSSAQNDRCHSLCTKAKADPISNGSKRTAPACPAVGKGTPHTIENVIDLHPRFGITLAVPLVSWQRRHQESAL